MRLTDTKVSTFIIKGLVVHPIPSYRIDVKYWGNNCLDEKEENI